MGAERAVLLGFGTFLAFSCMILIAYSTAGFSFNQAANRSAYWSYINQPVYTFKVGAGEVGLPNLNFEVFYGLRLYTVECSGKNCDNDNVNSYRWQNCDYDDDAGPFADHNVCNNCRVGGLATGSFIILALMLAVPAVGLMAARISEGIDNIGLRMGGVVLHTLIFVFELIALSIYSGLCYNNLDQLFDNDDVVDEGSVYYALGPGLIVNIVVLLLQPFLITFHAVVPHGGGEGMAGNTK